MNIQQLVKACQKKDRQAEKELFFCLAPKVLSLCKRYVRQNAQAQDFLQDCFLLAFAKLDSYDESKGRFEPWFFRLCTNAVLQNLRKDKKKIDTVYMEQLPEPQISEVAFQQLSDQQVLWGIRQLPDGYREVLNLHVFENWSHKEIGQQLGITESSSRSKLSRAKQLLKSILEKEYQKQHEKRLA